jgi:hypothetical protein
MNIVHELGVREELERFWNHAMERVYVRECSREDEKN